MSCLSKFALVTTQSCWPKRCWPRSRRPSRRSGNRASPSATGNLDPFSYYDDKQQVVGYSQGADAGRWSTP